MSLIGLLLPYSSDLSFSSFWEQAFPCSSLVLLLHYVGRVPSLHSFGGKNKLGEKPKSPGSLKVLVCSWRIVSMLNINSGAEEEKLESLIPRDHRCFQNASDSEKVRGGGMSA